MNNLHSVPWACWPRTHPLRAVAVAGLVAAALTVPAGGAAAAAGTCRITVLPNPAAAWESRATDIDPSGRYIIGTALVSGPGRSDVSLLWVDGRLTEFPTPYGWVGLADVNAAGTVVGYAENGSGAFAFRYQRGRFVTLPGLQPGAMTVARAVNRRGDVVGFSWEPNGPTRTVVWPAHQPGSPRELVAPFDVYTVDIDDDGTVLATGSFESVRWLPDGTVRPLTGPDGSPAVGVAIRRGWVAGVAGSGAAAWRTRGGPVNLAPPEYTLPTSVNRHGDLGFGGAIDRRHGGVVLVPGGGGGFPPTVTALSDRRTAVGFANVPSGTRAVIWTGC